MILLTAQLIRILLIIIVLFAGCVFLRKKVQGKILLFYGAIVILLALVSFFASEKLPPITDQVTLTAHNEKREDARGTEVFLAGYTIDGENFHSTSSLEIVEGHWFWTGVCYAWRPETDHRQPEGMTRSVVIKIPVGWSRTLNFSGAARNGKVAITVGNSTDVVDTYSDSVSLREVAIGRSATGALIVNQIRYLAAYAIILFGAAFVVLYLFQRILQAPEQTKTWLNRNGGKLINGGIALITLILMFQWAGKFSLWVDELYEIYTTAGTLKDALHCSFYWISTNNPPLEILFHTIWYHIAPYGEQWLLLPSMVISVTTIYLTGLIIENLYGRYCGIFSVILAACSTTLWTNAAYEFRPYSIFVFFATFTLFCHMKRNQSIRKTKWAIIFSLSLTGMAMTHYWGMIALACYFLADLYLWRTKRIAWTAGLSYILPGLISVTWVIASRIARGLSFGSVTGWYSIPNFSSVDFLLRFLTGNMGITFCLFFLGSAIACTCFFHRKAKFSWEKFYMQFSLNLVVGTVLLMVIYGNFINQKFTMWADRYFLFLLPEIFLLSALPLYGLEYIKNKCIKIQWQRVLCLFFGLYLSLNCIVAISSATTYTLNASATSTTRTTEPFREAADWLYTQHNYIYDEKTLVVTSWPEYVLSAWNEYYVTQQGRRDPLNTASWRTVTRDNLLQYDRVYFLYRGNIKECAKLLEILKENYTLEANKTDIRVQIYVRK